MNALSDDDSYRCDGDSDDELSSVGVVVKCDCMRSKSRHKRVEFSGESVGVLHSSSCSLCCISLFASGETLLAKFNRFNDLRFANREFPGGDRPNLGGVLHRVINKNSSSFRCRSEMIRRYAIASDVTALKRCAEQSLERKEIT